MYFFKNNAAQPAALLDKAFMVMKQEKYLALALLVTESLHLIESFSRRHSIIKKQVGRPEVK
jgi:hypothetical protein